MADNVDPDPPPPPPEVVVAQPVTPIPPTAPPPHQGCMDKRSTLEKILLVIVIIILIICLGFIAAFLVFYFFASPPEGTCLSEQCVKSASRLKSYMDEKVDPCSNFYQYACGGWIKSKNLDPHESRIGVESTISNMNRIKIRGILERTIDAEEAEYKTSPKVFYKSCMNTDKLDERGAEPFLKLVETVGKFPALDDSWNETDFNLENVLIKLTTIFVMPLFTVNVARDHNNSAVNRIYISDVTVDSGRHRSTKVDAMIHK
uniref:Peptidase M13 N-terminal domain-containing protein n=1 Tax=Arion vulgaris TaxID=1028688 RepID=A0A0B7ALX2_9EUPU